MRKKWYDKILRTRKPEKSWVQSVVSGPLFRTSDLVRSNTSESIRTVIDTMRALATDSQVGTALSFYATDATTVNSQGQILWATPNDPKDADVAETINVLLRRLKVNDYARDHILELATVGNLYIPTTDMYHERANRHTGVSIGLDSNTIPQPDFDIIPSTKIPPEDVLHLWLEGQPKGFLYKPEDSTTECTLYPEQSIIHFSLGGLIGDYTIEARVAGEPDPVVYDVQFATPLMKNGVQPTQTLSLLEDALLLSSFLRVIKFINVDCGDVAEEEEIQAILNKIKAAVEQQISMNTLNGDIQSYVNPQSPNNLIYMAKVKGQDAVSITDLNMSESSETESKLLTHFQDKKLSVLGVPKEAMNFSSNEGLGGAGNVMSQRSAIYANALQRLETAYISGWTEGINKYFRARNLKGFCNKFTLHMNPIITPLSTVQFEKRDAALSQAQMMVDLLKALQVHGQKDVARALSEILVEVFPSMATDLNKWKIDLTEPEGGDGGAF